jgi:hypothetical protein
MRLKIPIVGLIAAAVIAATAGSASADSVFTATDGSATVDLALSGGQLTIVLTNLTSADNTKSAADLLTGLVMLPNPPSLGGFSIVSQNGSQEFVLASGSTTSGTVSSGSFNPNWTIDSSPVGALYFNGFGAGGLPIIGGPVDSPVAYPSGGASLASGPHGTYIYETATFVLSAPTGFALSDFTGAVFLFNTDGSIEHSSTTPVPLPAAAGVGFGMLAGFGGLFGLRKKLRRRSRVA